jgi:cation diffusion facilitator CzcD-associated flavoprotein CzcO
VADRFELRPAFAFNTRVIAASYDEATGLWRVETEHGEPVLAQFEAD